MKAASQTLTASAQVSFPIWDQPPSLTIDSNGCILLASEHAEDFFEYPTGKLVGLYISALVPALDEIELPGHKSIELVRYLSRCGVSFMAQSGCSQHFPCHLSIVELHDSRNGSYRVVFTQPENCVMAADIYPQKS